MTPRTSRSGPAASNGRAGWPPPLSASRQVRQISPAGKQASVLGGACAKSAGETISRTVAGAIVSVPACSEHLRGTMSERRQLRPARWPGSRAGGAMCDPLFTCVPPARFSVVRAFGAQLRAPSVAAESPLKGRWTSQPRDNGHQGLRTRSARLGSIRPGANSQARGMSARGNLRKLPRGMCRVGGSKKSRLYPTQGMAAFAQLGTNICAFTEEHEARG